MRLMKPLHHDCKLPLPWQATEELAKVGAADGDGNWLYLILISMHQGVAVCPNGVGILLVNVGGATIGGNTVDEVTHRWVRWADAGPKES